MIETDLIIRCLAISQLFLTAILVWRTKKREASLAISLFCLSVISYLLLYPLFNKFEPGFITSIAFMLASMAQFFFLQVVNIFFRDRMPTLFHWLGFICFMLVVSAHLGLRLGGLGESTLGVAFYWAHLFLAMSMTIGAIVLILLSWNSDLLEIRRTIRKYLLFVFSIHILLTLAFKIFFLHMQASDVVELVNASAILLYSLVVNISWLSISKAYLNSVPVKMKLDSLEPKVEEDGLRKLLVKVFEEQQIYLEMNLKISDLADRIQTPEYRIRRFINGNLGYRNFNEFLNRYRVEEAARRLQDEDESILNISLDVGFSSLSSFNRAFKEVFMQTPSQFKREMSNRSRQ